MKVLIGIIIGAALILYFKSPDYISPYATKVLTKPSADLSQVRAPETHPEVTPRLSPPPKVTAIPLPSTYVMPDGPELLTEFGHTEPAFRDNSVQCQDANSYKDAVITYIGSLNRHFRSQSNLMQSFSDRISLVCTKSASLPALCPTIKNQIDDNRDKLNEIADKMELGNISVITDCNNPDEVKQFKKSSVELVAADFIGLRGQGELMQLMSDEMSLICSQSMNSRDCMMIRNDLGTNRERLTLVANETMRIATNSSK